MESTIKIEVNTLAQLESFVTRLITLLKPSNVLALQGPMGAGKTTFTQLLGKHLGVQEKIVSPTFVLIHDYVTGKLPIVHVDCYRLGPENANALEGELLSLFYDTPRERCPILVVEWADYATFLAPLVSYTIQWQYESLDCRTLYINSPHPELMNELHHTFPTVPC